MRNAMYHSNEPMNFCPLPLTDVTSANATAHEEMARQNATLSLHAFGIPRF